MAERLTIQIKDNDNVVVAVHDLPAGTKTESGVVTWDPIPRHTRSHWWISPPAARSSATAWCWAMQRTTSRRQLDQRAYAGPAGKPGTDRYALGHRHQDPGPAAYPAPDYLDGLPQQGRSCRHPQFCWYRHHCAVRCRRGEGWQWSASKRSCCPSTPMWTAWLPSLIPMAAALPSTPAGIHPHPCHHQCDQSS